MNVISQFPAACAYEPDVRFRAFFEGVAIGIGICQLDGQILEANGALSRMLGYSQQELLRTRADELYPDLRRNNDTEGQMYSGTLSIDRRLLGELMRGERHSFETEKNYRRKDGSNLWGHLTVSLGHDERQQPAFLIATLADATEHKRVEEHLREGEKMEVIGRLAGGIAHDFNNLLTGILLYCDLLSAGLESSHTCEAQPAASGRAEPCELCQHVEEVRRAGEQGAAMTQQLLAIARKQAAERRPVPINEIVASTENLLRRLIGEHIELALALDPAFDSSADAAGLVFADPAQLRQVLMNLVLNSRDAMPKGGTITVSTRASRFPDEARIEKPGHAEIRNSRPSISLTVTDEGCGMDEETRARLFEPFFTTKNPGEGTGLGLATVHRIVSESGGLIAVKSAAGCGTRIEVFFPAIAPPANPFSNELASLAQLPQKNSILPGSRGKTILLVDDNALARRSMQRILHDAGYRILATSSGKQALKIVAEHSRSTDLLIADCMMPSMNGREFAEAMLRKKPDLKILLISGYENQPLVLSDAVAMIRKPFSGKALLDRVLEVLHREANPS